MVVPETATQSQLFISSTFGDFKRQVLKCMANTFWQLAYLKAKTKQTVLFSVRSYSLFIVLVLVSGKVAINTVNI